MAVFPEEAGRANDDVQAVNTSLDRELGIAHVAADVCQDLGLEAKLADGFAVPARLLGRGRRGQFDVVDAELIEGLGDLDLGLGVEVGVGELFAL
jgi:S1-C subfamily serine protease